MRSPGRIAVVITAVAALLAFPGATQPAEAAATSAYTRVRLTVVSSSDWTTVQLLGISTLDRAIVSTPAGSQVVPNSRGFAFRTPTPSDGATAVVDEVLEVSSTAKPVLRVAKGDIGSVQVTIDRTNATDVVIATLDTGTQKLVDGHIDQPIARATLVGEGLSIAPVDSRKLVLAFYYPWFRSGSFDSGVWYDRPSGAYATDDPASVGTMVDQAQGAGINGFIVSWNGSSTSASRFDLLAQTVATRPGFSIAAYLELAELHQQNGRTDIGAITTAASEALTRSAQTSYLEVGNRPVLFVYGTWTLTPADWQQVMRNLATMGYDPFVVGDGSDPAFAFDGFHLYNPNGLEPADLRTFDWTSARRLRIPHVLHPEIPQGLWAATVSPGQNTVGRTLSGSYRSRDGGLRYDKTWSAALDSSPDWVLITSFFKYPATTEIQPAQTAGWRALDQTTTWSARFHS
jgi:hypothetical protein